MADFIGLHNERAACVDGNRASDVQTVVTSGGTVRGVDKADVSGNRSECLCAAQRHAARVRNRAAALARKGYVSVLS